MWRTMTSSPPLATPMLNKQLFSNHEHTVVDHHTHQCARYSKDGAAPYYVCCKQQAGTHSLNSLVVVVQDT